LLLYYKKIFLKDLKANEKIEIFFKKLKKIFETL